MGKYDDLIGGGRIVIDVNDVLNEQIDLINERKLLAEKLILLTEDDIKSKSDDIEYLNYFVNTLKDYIKKL